MPPADFMPGQAPQVRHDGVPNAAPLVSDVVGLIHSCHRYLASVSSGVQEQPLQPSYLQQENMPTEAQFPHTGENQTPITSREFVLDMQRQILYRSNSKVLSMIFV